MRSNFLLEVFTSSFLLLNFYLLLQHTGVNALSSHVFQKYRQMADMGLLPDGSPMEKQTVDARVMFTADFSDVTDGNDTATAERKEVILPEYVTLPLDHFGDAPGTFENRFWVSEVDYKPGGPIFIYDVGEANGSSQAIFRLQNETSFFKMIVKKFNGMGIVWEHRFYGNSSPVNISLNTPSKDFKYLTAQQALADVATFAWQFKRADQKFDLTPASTPWAFIGGSYPGMRAAFVRKFYPGTIFAGYASSAPVEASVDMSFYFDPLWRGLNADGYGNCTQDIKAAVRAMDDIMDRNDPKEYGALFEKFLGKGAANNTRAGFADALATMYAYYQSYGIDGVPYNLRSLCDHLSHDPATNKTAGAEGWAATKGANFTIDRWASWPYFAYVVNDNMYTSCAGPYPQFTAELSSLNIASNQTKLGTNTTKVSTTNVQTSLNASSVETNATSIALNATAVFKINCDLQLRASDPAAISWGWQYCTQWGFMQSSLLNERQLGSKYNSLQHQHDVCHRQFPDGTASGLLPDWPQAEETNKIFGGWNIKPTNVYWTGGQWDPWRTLSPLSDLDFSPKFEFNHTIPPCGTRKPASYDSLFAYLLPDSGHAYDFRGTYNASIPARNLWNNALQSWLKCYTKWNPFVGGESDVGSEAGVGATGAKPGPDAGASSVIHRLARRDELQGDDESLIIVPDWEEAHNANEWWANLDTAVDLPLGEEGISEEEQMRRELARVKRSWAKVDGELTSKKAKRNGVKHSSEAEANLKRAFARRTRYRGAKKTAAKLDNTPLDLVY